jgi:hypothetical protein
MDDDKERFDAFMALADFRREIRESRRGIEWRVTLGLWAALAAASISIPAVVPIWIVAGCLFVVILFHCFWVKWHFLTHETERISMYYYKDSAEYLLCPDEVEKPNRILLEEPPKGLEFLT